MLAESNFFTWDGWGFVGAVATIIIPIILGSLGHFYRLVIAQLEDKQDRERIKAELEGRATAFQLYQSALSGFSVQADKWFGYTWGLRALSRCLKIAFLYPISLLIMAWFFGMGGTIGSIQLLPDMSGSWRMIVGVALATTISTGLYLYRNQYYLNYENNSNEKHHDMNNDLSLIGYSKLILKFFAYIVFASFIIFIFLISVGMFFRDFTALFTFFFCLTLIISLRLSLLVTFSYILCVVVSFVAAGPGPGAGSVATTVIVFLCLLPLTNAALDMVSWGITRTLLAEIDHTVGGVRGVVLVIGAIALDVVVAIACLVCLAALTAMMLELANLLFSWRGFPDFDWRSQLTLARASPFSEGLLVTGMLATTLVPTVIHLTVGIGHAMTAWLSSAHQTTALINDGMPTSAKHAVAWVVLCRKLWMLPAFVVVCLIGWGLLAAFAAWIEPFGLFLEQVAFASAALIAEP